MQAFAPRAGWARLLASLPRGGALPDDVWRQRHRGILLLLWAHVPAVAVFALTRGQPLLHSLEEATAVAFFAGGAVWFRDRRLVAMTLTAMGLLTASAALVHLSNGVIEMHFHYFVMVGVITLYQDWTPFLVAIGYVVLQHGVFGGFWPESVYNHEAAVRGPWKWAGIHGTFILGMSAAGIVTWRLNEGLLRNLSERQQRLAEAQELARVGSWERDLRTNVVTWSDQHYELLQLDRDTPNPREAFLSMIDPDDRRKFQGLVIRAIEAGDPFALDLKISLPSGETRWMHARGEATQWADGQPVVLAGTTQDVTERHRSEDAMKETLSLLNATLDSTADGILVVDNEGKITSFNRQFAEMWRIPQPILDRRDDDAALQAVLGQLADPEGFVAKVRELYTQPDAESHDVLDFKDGRVFDRYSKPQLVGGVAVGRVWSFRDITDRKRLEAELAHQAFHDSLTGLANQLLFRDRVEHALTRANRNREVLTVVFVDLDNFKTVNDSFGHPAGDSLLLAVGERLRACLRATDTAARMGGDEFAILLENGTTVSEATEVATRILEALRLPFTLLGMEVVLSASVGIAFTESGTETTDVLLRNADLAMYRAKAAGKNGYQVFEPEMHSEVVERLELENDLRRAIERREFVLQYQPIVELSTGRIAGVEALVRWDHPDRGRLYPDAFIAVAEETGLINDIGLQVIEQALHRVETWRRRFPGNADLLLSVNLSPRQLAEPRLVRWVADIIDASGCDPANLIFEITESVTVRREVGHQLDALKQLGLRLAVDDFGTGYSSLSYLQRLPIDIIKIDRAFVSGSDGAALPRAIIELAHALKLTTIAEGVETAEQGDRLQDWGCELAQGYHLHRPQDPDAIEALLASSLVP
jgi:diguanylate cyclase (GGDEF)-like protein/PAS domain S-box-containing protein